MITISLCMIVRDEEQTLVKCLDSVYDIVDEMVIIDTGSIDSTKDIAHRYTSNIFDFQWIDDFSAARNFSFSKATMDYILWLDADDIILDEDRQKLMLLKEQLDSTIDIVMLKYNLDPDEKERPSCSYYRERLIKRSGNYMWHDPVHEYIIPSGKVACADISVTHKKSKTNSLRNLRIFEKLIREGKELSHRNYFYYARELTLNSRYDEAREYYNKFLDHVGGLFSNYMDACIDLSKIYTLEGDKKKAIWSLFRSFEYGPPRAEVCCELGRQFTELKELETAIAWFKIASKLGMPKNTIGAVVYDCYNYTPYLELSSCYLKLGKIKEAVFYNELAAQCKPDSLEVIKNRNFFEAFI